MVLFGCSYVWLEVKEGELFELGGHHLKEALGGWRDASFGLGSTLLTKEGWETWDLVHDGAVRGLITRYVMRFLLCLDSI